MKTRSNAQRAADSDANLERKRAYLARLIQMVAAGQSLAGLKYPTNMQEFREFEDAEHNLRKVGSPKLLNRKSSSHRVSFIDEVDGYLATLATFKATGVASPKKPSLRTQVDALKVERDDLKYLVGRLLSQLAMQLDENHKLRARERSAEATKKLTSDTIKNLNKKVVKLGGTLLKGVRSDE